VELSAIVKLSIRTLVLALYSDHSLAHLDSSQRGWVSSSDFSCWHLTTWKYAPVSIVFQYERDSAALHVEMVPVCVYCSCYCVCWRIGLCSVLRPHQHSIGYMGDGCVLEDGCPLCSVLGYAFCSLVNSIEEMVPDGCI